MSLAKGNFVTHAPSKTLADTQKNVLRFFRLCLKEADAIISLYALDVTRNELRTRMKEEFYKHKNLKDVQVIDVLLFKGRTELEETKLAWKTKSHVCRFFQAERAGRSAAEMNRIQAKREADIAHNNISDFKPTQAQLAMLKEPWKADKHTSPSL